MNAGRPLTLDPLPDVIEDIRRGRMIIMVDDSDRENEGDLVVATEALTADHVSFMLKHARGLICASIASETAARLELPLQVTSNRSPFHTPFSVSVDHKLVRREGVTAAARTFTMRSLIDPSTGPADLVAPGHVFPLIANAAGVLGRQGQTEGSFDIARIAGFEPSGVICEILAPDGTMSRGDALEVFAREHGLRITSVAEIIRYRLTREVAVREVTSSQLNTDVGPAEVLVYRDDVAEKEHLAVLVGDVRRRIARGESVPARIHSECLTGDVFGSRRCDCGPQLAAAMRYMVDAGGGVVLYLRQEGRGIGLSNKLRAYRLQDEGHDTVEANERLGFAADERDFAVAHHMLASLGVRSVELLTNNPRKVEALERGTISVTRRVPVVVPADEFSRSYLETKRTKLGHLLDP